MEKEEKMKGEERKEKVEEVEEEKKEKKRKTEKKDGEKEAIEEFVREILEKYKKEIKAIWGFNLEREWVINLLVDDLKINEEKIDEIKVYALKLDEKIEKKHGVTLHTKLLKVTRYYDYLIENRIDIFLEIKKSVCFYDPSGFFNPIKILIEKGEIKGTKEAIYRLITQVKKNMKELREIKLDVLGKIYSSVIDAAEAALIVKGVSFFIPNEIPKALEREFLGKKLISKKTFNAFEDIYNTYKAYEHGEIEEIDGKKLDELIKKADLFITEMQDLVSKTI